MKIEVITEKNNSAFIVKLRGDVDMNSSSDVRAVIGRFFKESSREVKALLIDLSQVRYMDSSGIATLVEAMQTAMKQGLRLRLVNLSPAVNDVFEMARLSSVFEIFPSIEDAVKGLS